MNESIEFGSFRLGDAHFVLLFTIQKAEKQLHDCRFCSHYHWQIYIQKSIPNTRDFSLCCFLKKLFHPLLCEQKESNGSIYFVGCSTLTPAHFLISHFHISYKNRKHEQTSLRGSTWKIIFTFPLYISSPRLTVLVLLHHLGRYSQVNAKSVVVALGKSLLSYHA